MSWGAAFVHGAFVRICLHQRIRLLTESLDYYYKSPKHLGRL